MKNKINVQKLCVSAIMIALATVLSMIKVFQMPLGGSITLLSMLPIVTVGILYGAGWGFSAAGIYAVIQFMFGVTIDGLFAWGLDAPSLIACILLDYILAYTALGIAGIFYKKGYFAVILGTAAALFARFVFHFLSGAIIFANFEKFVIFGQAWVGRPFLYSLCYNGLYMLPELVLTCVAVAFIAKSPLYKRYADL